MGKAVLIFSLLIAVFVQPVQKHKEPGSIFPLNGNVTVIYDNDDFRDVYTDEYLLALSALKEIRLKGMITTYSPREYKSFVAGRKAIMEISEQSGIKYLPELLTGTDKKLIRPENSRMEDTTPLDIEGSRIIVINALKASAKKPVVIITGGQLTTVANAWLLDPSISDKVVVMGVFGAEKIDYNAALDPWAWTIILSNFRVAAIPMGPPASRGEVYMKPPVVPKERIKTELSQEIPIFRWMYEKKHPSNGLPGEADFDGHPAILITRPDYVKEWKRFECTGINDKGYPVLVEKGDGKIWQAEKASQQIATDEFWRIMYGFRKLLEDRHRNLILSSSFQDPS